MPPTGRTLPPQANTPGAGSTPAAGCAYPIGEGTCRQQATRQLPVGYASNADPMPLCDQHAARFLGATTALP